MGSIDARPSPQLLEELAQFFRLLSEPAQLQVLCLLKPGSMDVGSLMEATEFFQSHISRQLSQLQRIWRKTSALWCKISCCSGLRSSFSNCNRPELRVPVARLSPNGSVNITERQRQACRSPCGMSQVINVHT